MKLAELNSNRILHIAEFAAVVAVSVVFGAVAFYRVLGALAVIHGATAALVKSVPVGI